MGGEIILRLKRSFQVIDITDRDRFAPNAKAGDIIAKFWSELVTAN
jgi:hypothetical protein